MAALQAPPGEENNTAAQQLQHVKAPFMEDKETNRYLGNEFTGSCYISNVSPNASPALRPSGSPSRGPVGEDEEFELCEQSDPSHPSGGPKPRMPRSDEPAYVVPATPSPYMHASFPPGATAVPPLGAGMLGFTPDQCSEMGLLPPAFEPGFAEGGPGYGEDPGNTAVMYNVGLDGNFWGPTAYATNGMPMDGTGYDGNALSAAQLAEWVNMYGGWAPDGGAYPVMENGARPMENQELEQSEATDTGAKPARKDKKKGKGDIKDQQQSQIQTTDWGDLVEATDVSQGGGQNSETLSGTSPANQQAKNGKEAAKEAKEETEAKDDAAPAEDENGRPVNYTTVMLRNIPNKYTREMLIEQLSADFRGEFDFLYLPIDFKNKCNVGYGFINFRTVECCDRFVSMFDGVDVRKCLPGLNSKKVAEVTPARVQGFSENVRRLRNSPVMNQLIDHPEWMPVLFNEQGEDEPFPLPDTPLPPMKPRGRGRLAHIKGLD